MTQPFPSESQLVSEILAVEWSSRLSRLCFRGGHDLGESLMCLLVHYFKLSRPQRSQFLDPGFRALQVYGILEPEESAFFLSSDDIKVPLHGRHYSGL